MCGRGEISENLDSVARETGTKEDGQSPNTSVKDHFVDYSDG